MSPLLMKPCTSGMDFPFQQYKPSSAAAIPGSLKTLLKGRIEVQTIGAQAIPWGIPLFSKFQ